MSQWKNDDSAANSVLWAVSQFGKPANSTTRAALFGNTTANAYFPGATIGLYGIDANEQLAMRTNGVAPTHSGWVLKTTGQGGRSGRVFYETLVAGGSMTGDAEDVTGYDYAIVIRTQPSSTSGNSTANQLVTFSVNATSVPSGATLAYQWQKWDGSAFANVSNAGAYSNVTTQTMSVKANTAANGEIYRVMIANTAANTIYSTNAVITITT